MSKTRKYAAGYAACFALAMAFLAVLLTWQPASASSGPRTPAQQACGYFRAWAHGHQAWALNAMMGAAVYAPWHPLGVDANVLFTQERDGDHADRAAAVADMSRDCKRIHS